MRRTDGIDSATSITKLVVVGEADSDDVEMVSEAEVIVPIADIDDSVNEVDDSIGDKLDDVSSVELGQN